MLNKQQREFRKNMKAIQREKQKAGYEDPYRCHEANHRYRCYRKPLFVGGGSMAFLILLWNLYSITTWIHPRHFMDSAPLPITPNTSTLSSRVDNTQQQVHDYIQTSAAIEQQLNALIQPFLNPDTLNFVSSQTFTVTESQLDNLQHAALTNLDALTALRSYNLKQIELMQSALSHAKVYQGNRNPSEWRLFQKSLKQYNANLKTKQTIVTSLLDKEHMPYQIDANGHITYHYNSSTDH